MNNITLLIMAAGMGSRYGGLKQLDAIGPSGETIIDYSVYDAIKAGFTKVVFIFSASFGNGILINELVLNPPFFDALEEEFVAPTIKASFNPCITSDCDNSEELITSCVFTAALFKLFKLIWAVIVFTTKPNTKNNRNLIICFFC